MQVGIWVTDVVQCHGRVHFKFNHAPKRPPTTPMLQGRTIHNAIHRWLTVGAEPTFSNEGRKHCWSNFLSWAKRVNAREKFKIGEETLVSLDHRFHGKPDCYLSDEKLVEFKTRGPREEDKLQLGGYKILLDEKGYPVRRGIILYLSRGVERAVKPDVNGFLAQLRSLREEMEKEEFIFNPGPWCHSCPWSHICNWKNP